MAIAERQVASDPEELVIAEIGNGDADIPARCRDSLYDASFPWTAQSNLQQCIDEIFEECGSCDAICLGVGCSASACELCLLRVILDDLVSGARTVAEVAQAVPFVEVFHAPDGGFATP